MNNAETLLTPSGKAIGFFPVSFPPRTQATTFIDACLASLPSGSRPSSPPYTFIEQRDSEEYQRLKCAATAGSTAKHKTQGIQATLGVHEKYVLKSLIFRTTENTPVCIVMNGDATVNTRVAAKILGVKNIYPLTPTEVTEITGYIVGGCSAFGTKTPMKVLVQSTILTDHQDERYIINGGGQSFLLLIHPSLLNLLNSPYAKSIGCEMITGNCMRKRDNTITSAVFTEQDDSPPSTPHTTTLTVDCDPIETFKLLQQEIEVLTAAYPSNNITIRKLPPIPHPNTIIFSRPSDAARALSLAEYDHESVFRMYADITPLDITIYLPISYTDRANNQERSILLHLIFTVTSLYPAIPLSNITLQAPGIADFISIFDVDSWIHDLVTLSQQASTVGEVAIMALISHILESHTKYFRSGLVGLHLATNNTSSTSQNIFSPLDNMRSPYENIVLSSEDDPTGLLTTIGNTRPLDNIGLDPLDIWKWDIHGTFPIDYLDKLTPDQRYVIYHQTPLNIPAREKLGVVYDKIVETLNKVTNQLNGPGNKTPQQLLPRITTYDIVQHHQFVLQPSSPLQHIDFAAGERPAFLQKKKSLIKAGLVGLPNVGKSSLFNALCKSSVPASNYAFCTIKPNICLLPCVDERFNNIVKHTLLNNATVAGANGTSQSTEKIKPEVLPAFIQIVDIAGIISKACLGAGLGNAFLHDISTVDVIYQVVRVFNDPHTMDSSVEHVNSQVDPIRDIHVINTELLEKDIEQFYRRISRYNKYSANTRWNNTDVSIRKDNYELSVLIKCHKWLVETRRPLRYCRFTPNEAQFIATLQTWTSKPVCYILNMSMYQYCNVKQREFLIKKFQDHFNALGYCDVVFIPICVIYEQARAAYHQRYLPFVNQPQFTYQDKNTECKYLQFEGDEEVYCIAAIGREIQAIRRSFESVITSPKGVDSTLSLKSENEKNKHDKKDDKLDGEKAEKKKNDGNSHKEKKDSHHNKKDQKKDKSSSSKDSKKDKKSTSKDPLFGDLAGESGAGGFADFLGDDLFGVPAPVDNNDKKHSKKIEPSPEQLKPAIEGNLLEDLPTISLEDEFKEGDSNASTRFWTKVDQLLLLKYYPIHSLLKQIAQDDVDLVPIEDKSDAMQECMTDYDQETGEGVNDSADTNTQFIDDNEQNDNPTFHGDEPIADVMALAKGKVLFIDYNNPTPLASLIITGFKLGRIIQYFVVQPQLIRGIMVPEDVDARHAALRLSFDLYENFGSCEVMKYDDYQKMNFSLQKVREKGLLVQHGKSYIVNNNDIISFKRAKTTAVKKDEKQ